MIASPARTPAVHRSKNGLSAAMKPQPLLAAAVALCTCLAALPAARALEVTHAARPGPGSLNLAGGAGAVMIAVDAKDDALVQFAARMFADDVARVTGKRPAIAARAGRGRQMVIAGTLGQSALVDRLAASGKLKDLDKIRGRWEATVTQMVERPFPGVERAFVIVGSDRRGAAYGLIQLSERIGCRRGTGGATCPSGTGRHWRSARPRRKSRRRR
jgi:hypothetical protein